MICHFCVFYGQIMQSDSLSFRHISVTSPPQPFTTVIVSLYNADLLFCFMFYFYHAVSCFDWFLLTKLQWVVLCPLGFPHNMSYSSNIFRPDSIVSQYNDIVIPKFMSYLHYKATCLLKTFSLLKPSVTLYQTGLW